MRITGKAARRRREQGEQALLEISDLRVEYHSPRGVVRAVDDVSLTIRAGEVVGLAGESGCGKSTLAQAILRTLQPPAVITGGRVLVGGRDVLAMDDDELRDVRWSQVSMVFQSAMNALNPVLTIGDQIADTIRAHDRSISRRQARRRAAEILRTVGVEESRIDAYPHQLSGGMRQRVVIGIALVLHPPLVILDEPTTALDVVVQREIMAEISELKERLGVSILFITHDISLLAEIADRIAIMYAGQIVEVASAGDLLEERLHPYTQGLMASFPSLTGPPTTLTGIPGSPPDLVSPPSGCRFHSRCPKRMVVCDRAVPKLAEAWPNHQVACHLYQPSRPETLPSGALAQHPQRMMRRTVEEGS